MDFIDNAIQDIHIIFWLKIICANFTFEICNLDSNDKKNYVKVMIF